MSVLVVGADYISSIESYLKSVGHDKIRHWPARNNSECHKTIPNDIELVVVLINYLNHGMARHVRKIANDRGLPMVFSRRSVPELDMALKKLKIH